MNDSDKVAFIIGSPRSGTTILGNILNHHPEIVEWYEPYYVWLKYFDNSKDDIWDIPAKNGKTSHYIWREFVHYKKKMGASLVIDKSPGHALNIAPILSVFPNSKWIHILRDGRDATLSINKEWRRREQIVQKKDFIKLVKTARQMIRRQPLFRYKFMALWFELTSNLSLNPRRYLNKSKWQGNIGWGPRFKGWDEYLESHTAIEFNAMQWHQLIKAVHSSWASIPKNNKLEIRYEKLLQNPRQYLTSILNFLGFSPENDFFNVIPSLKSNNFNKWKTEFTQREIELIKPILSPMLDELGYTTDMPW